MNVTKLIKPLGAIVAGLLVLGGAGLALRAGGDGTYQVTAYFTKAIGLYPNSDVTILGVPVGNIRDVKPIGQRVRVVLDVEDKYKVSADARAQIVPISVISDRYVELFPTYESGPTLSDGDVIPEDRTQIPAELDDVFRQLQKLLEAIEPGEEGEPGALGELIVQINDALTDREDELKGTLVSGAAVTRSLARASDDIEGMLSNLDSLFTQLSSRAHKLGSLNSNFAAVMTALAESRDDLRGTLRNLAGMTNELGDFVRDNQTNLSRDVRLASNVLKTIVDNRASVEESLSWLPVVGRNLGNAYHGGEIKATDVRDNATSARCDELDQLPQPIQDALEDLINELCGRTSEPREQSSSTSGPSIAELPPLEEIDCTKAVRQARRQIRKISKLGSVPADVRAELVKPLKKNLRRLARECERVKEALDDPDSLLNELLDSIGTSPDLDDPRDEVDGITDGLTGAAAGTTGVIPVDAGEDSTFGQWLRGLFGFVGWSR